MILEKCIYTARSYVSFNRDPRPSFQCAPERQNEITKAHNKRLISEPARS